MKDPSDEIIEGLKKKYDVKSLEEFSRKVKEEKIKPRYHGDFEYEDDYFLWRNAEQVKKLN